MKQNKDARALKLVLRYFSQEIRTSWYYSIPALLLPGIGTILTQYVPPLIIGKAANNIGNNITIESIAPYMLMLGAVWLSGELLWRIGNHLINRVDARGLNNLHMRAMRAITDKEMSFFGNNFTGSLTKKIISFAKSYEGFIDNLAFSAVPNIIPLLFVSIILWGYSPLIVLVLLAMLAVTISFMTPMIKRRLKLVIARENARNNYSGLVADVVTNMASVKADAQETQELKTHDEYAFKATDAALRSWDYQNLRIDIIASPLYVLTNIFGLLALVAFAPKNIINIETLFVTFSYYASITRIVWDFNRIYRNAESTVSEASQFTELLLDEPAIKDIANPQKPGSWRGDIRFRGVNFAYPDSPEDFIFRGLNLHIKPGEKIGIVGQSGGGKTTITKLLLRFNDVTNGSIFVDNVDIAQMKQRDLRAHISYVSQEPLMFHRSVLDNIRYARKSATQKEINIIARQANAYDFIQGLKDGYDTLVGERGVKLSGGQRQRIAIARAMLKNAPILILDEATSALDSESEVLIQEALWRLMERRTAIVIAHRLSTIQKMDRILVMDNGVIVEQGTHKELIRQSGTYSKLWSHQSGGFIED